MIKINSKVYRNLEEQVQYLTSYHDANQGLVQWGIRVVGQVESESELPVPYDGDYGDAIAVGTEAPFFFYIWTRASIEGDPPYWFPFGEISIVGPEGPKGDKGDKGDTGESTRWYVGTDASNVENPKEGDLFLVSDSGTVLQYENGKWTIKAYIKGPQGIQGIRGPKGDQGETGPVGPQGQKGDVGGIVNLYGMLTNTEQLPLPTDLNNLSIAYLVEHTGGTDQSNDYYDLYVQVGSSPATATWVNAGPFNAATLVTSGGLGLNVWDADTKLDKDTHTTEYNQVYVKAADGGQGSINVTKQIVGDAVVQRQSNGNITVPNPQVSNDATSKGYVDLQLSNKLQKSSVATDENQVYGKTADGKSYMFNVSRNALGASIAQRTANGQIRVGAPSRVDDAANKQYVDNATMTTTYEDFTGETTYYLQGDATYMAYSDYANLSLRNADGSVVKSDMKQFQIMVATQAKYPTGAWKVCGNFWQGSGYPDGIRKAISRGGYIYAPTGMSICKMSKPNTEA